VQVSEKTSLPMLETSEHGVYHIYSMRYSRADNRRIPENFLTRDHDAHDGPMPVDYNPWIVRNGHRTILVDTGFGAKAAAERHRRLDFDPIEGLSRVGINPDEIENIILTHLHFDHAGNIDRFAKARFHLQDAKIAFATGRCMCERYLRGPFAVEDVLTLVRHTYAERVCFHDGDAAPFPGIALHALPGHSMGLQSVQVMTPRGPIVLASDVTHFYANFLRRSPPRTTAESWRRGVPIPT
jgi:glyoxylase-like metal-dependent hydrolase (beta-lactamase superfamily II)